MSTSAHLDPRQTLEQRRAAHALAKVREIKQNGNYGNFPSYVDGLPATIVMNGLGQAMATLLAQAKGNERDAHRMLYDRMQTWLCGRDGTAPYQDQADLMDAITSGDQASYLRAQHEALAYLVWLKKFSRALLDAGETS